jgi:hypothetical protein
MVRTRVYYKSAISSPQPKIFIEGHTRYYRIKFSEHPCLFEIFKKDGSYKFLYLYKCR